MDTLPDHAMRTYAGGDQLPAEAVDLFGDEATKAWDSDSSKCQPVCLGAAGEGVWLAGVLIYLETLPTDGTVEAKKVASIRQMIVRPEHRGRGLAGRMIRRAITLARSAGCTRIRSTAGWGCPDHLMLYERLRFERAPSNERPYLVSLALGDA
ncbi:MAG: GNAT family N-acetyltransferase [Planctomycetes bacterium]|nr:GNAT family N-acetyltransferase [Planctomycetota bacterium]